MLAPSFHGRFILYLAAVVVTALLFLLHKNMPLSYGICLILWGALGLYHLAQLGWPVAQIWGGIRSLPADLLRGLSQKEDSQRQASQAHLARSGVIMWPFLGLIYLVVSVVVSLGAHTAEPLLLLQQQVQGLDGLDIQMSPGLMPLLQHTAFGLIAGIIFLLGASFSGDVRNLRRTVSVSWVGAGAVCGIVVAQNAWTFSPPLPPATGLAGWGVGLAEFLSAFRHPGFETVTPFFSRLYDTGLAGVVLGGTLILLPLVPVFRFIGRFRQHILWLGGIPVMAVLLGAVDLMAAGRLAWEPLLVLVLPALSVAGGYARFRLSNPYAP
jgi:hypothetical protein